MKSKLFLLVIISFFIINEGHAQKRKRAKKTALKGLVIDTENNPVINASIFIDGKNCGTLSDEDGLFEIKVKSDVKTITIFTLFNGVTELKYHGQEKITFVLIQGNTIMQDPLNTSSKKEEDLVDVGYGKVLKRNLITSVGIVNKEHIKNTYHYSNIYAMIKGEVSGVTVSGGNITIRGISSLNLSNEPLFVVDGVPTSGISDLSPDDVKSISVLKGASAAIYGSRGANGVILIRLKTAKDR